MDTAETVQQVKSQEETLSKALKGICDVVNAPDANVQVVIEEYDKFATIYDKVSI